MHAPLKTRFVTSRPSAPWYSEEIAAEKLYLRINKHVLFYIQVLMLWSTSIHVCAFTVTDPHRKEIQLASF